jgi:hypothetical protein
MACTDRNENRFARMLPLKWVQNSDRSFRLWTIPVVLFIVSVLSFGLYANQQGFYWDDWSFAWTRFFRGFEGLKELLSVTRPMRAYIDSALTPLFGVNPFAWHILAILMRWLAAVSLWWVLRQVWPTYVRPVFVVALLFLVYPGFSQQAIAMTYYYFWFLQVILFLSFGLMLRAAQVSKFSWAAMIIALLLSVLQLFSSEHFFGVELLRPVFLWVFLGSTIPDFKKRTGRTVQYYAPFVLLLVIFLCWRLFIFKFPGYQPTLLGSLQSSPLQGLLGLIKTVGHTMFTVSLQAWSQVFQIPVLTEGGRVFATLYPWILIICLVGLILYQERLTAQIPAQQEKRDRKYAWQFIVVGLIAILFAGIPYYFTNLPVWLTFPENRFTLPFALGVSLLLAPLLDLLPKPSYTIALVSAITALAIGLHFYSGYLYRNERDLQNTFLWQLTWRAPAFRQGTLLLSDDYTFQYTDDEGLTAALNWTYAPENHTAQLPYAYFIISGRLRGALPSLGEGVPVKKNYFWANFSGTTNQVIVTYFAPPSCLRVLDPIYDANIVSLPVASWDIAGQPKIQEVRFLPQYTLEALPLANMDSILLEPQQAAKPPAFMFSSEPKHNWCYLFEKGDLARQAGDWETVASLGDEAIKQFYYPNDLSEYLVFIEAYTHLSRWQDAQVYSERVAGWAPVLTPSLCEIWHRAEQFEHISDHDRALVATVKQELRCPAP